MSNIDEPKPKKPSADEVREEWLGRLSALIAEVQTWAEAMGWSTRQIEKKMSDSEIGEYEAPALLLQEETTRILLEPIGRSAPGAEGIVDLYLMPAYDDIASFYYYDGSWHMRYMSPGTTSVAELRETEARPLSQETLQDVLGEMRRNAV